MQDYIVSYLQHNERGQNIRHSDTLSRSLSKSEQVFLQSLADVWISPAVRIELVGVWEDFFVVVHDPCTHANDGLLCLICCLAGL